MRLPDMPEEFFWDYLRGEIDGDGHIVPPKPNSIEVGINIVGNKNFIIDILSVLSDKIQCPLYALNYNCKDNRICTLPIYSKYAYKLLKNVYQNKRCGLSRKKQLALKIINQYELLQNKKCNQCGIKIVDATNRRKFCSSCIKIRQQVQRNIYRKNNAKTHN